MPKVTFVESFKQKHRQLYDALEFLAIVLIAWLCYQGLGVALQTPTPMLSVVSGSMEPTLHIGDLVIVSKADYRAGDIAIYLRGKVTIIHRIIDVREGGYVFKGDNNPAPDPELVPQERVLGKVRLAVPLLGFPRLALYALGI